MATSIIDRAIPGGTDEAPAGAPNKGRRRINRTLKYALLLFFVIVILIPAYVLFITSFKGTSDADPSRAWLLPQSWETAGWAKAWTTLAPALGRTFLLVIPAALISATLGSINGYVLSKWRFPGANVVFTLILFGMFIPYQAVMIPLTQLMSNLGVPQGIPSLMLLHIVYGLPICTLIFRNYYESVPSELIEAARMDGAGILRTYASVILPGLRPGLRGRADLAVHLRLERLPVRGVLLLGPQRAGDHRAELPGRRPAHRLRGLHGRRADRLGPDADRLHPARQVLRRRPDERLGQGLIRSWTEVEQTEGAWWRRPVRPAPPRF